MKYIQKTYFEKRICWINQLGQIYFHVEFLYCNKLSHGPPMTCLFTSEFSFWNQLLDMVEACSDSAPRRNKASLLLVFLIDSLSALLSWDFFSGAMYSLTMACKWKGKVFKQKWSTLWLLDYRCILRQINFRKKSSIWRLILLKILDSENSTWKTTIIKSVKIRRVKLSNSLRPFGVLIMF